MAGYVIGSEKGKQIANSMKAGSTYKASDGSTWKKNSDGSVSVTTKNGGYTANALSGSSSSNKSSNTSSKNTSSKNNSSASNTVKTNTSYNGNYLSVDLNTDYQSKINEAVSKGDYASASQYEALRNAKINYLNSTGNNSNKYETSNKYTNVYTQSKGAGGAGTNNAGGTVYSSKYNTIGDLDDNWTSANVNGVNYTKDKSGKIYGNGYLVGDGYNKDTNEFTYSNQEDARKAAYDKYIMSGAFENSANLDKDSMYKYIQEKGLVDEAYVNAIQNGTSGQYSADVIARAKAEQDKARAIAAAQEEARWKKILNMTDEERNVYFNGSSASSATASPAVNENSFETDTSQNSLGLDNEAYLSNLNKLLNRGYMRRY